jgi:hypothetical protein
MSLGTRGNDASAYKTWQLADFFGLRGNRRNQAARLARYRLTVSALLSASGLSPSTNSKLYRLIDELRESREQFEDRAFTYWVSHIQNRRQLTIDRFGQITGLSPLSDKLRERFTAWRAS